MTKIFFIWYSIIGISIILFANVAYVAYAGDVSFVVPNSKSCPGGMVMNSYDSLSGEFTCINDVYGNQTSGTSGNLTGVETDKLKTFVNKLSSYDDSTHTYLNSRFNGVGENLIPSGSQFQVYCDGVTNQDCYIFITSSDSKEGGIILSKNINGAWSKIGSFVESTDHSNFQITGYDSNGAGISMIKFYDDRIEMQNKVRIMSKNTATGITTELIRTWDDNRISLYSGADRCYVTRDSSGYLKCN